MKYAVITVDENVDTFKFCIDNPFAIGAKLR